MRLNRLFAILSAALVSGAMVYAIANFDDGSGSVSGRLSDHILTLLSILGGIMIAVMAALGDNALGRGRRYDEDAAQAAVTKLRMGYVHILFWLYLVAILAIMFSGPIGLMNKTVGTHVGQFGAFIGIFSALLSLGLPGFFLRLNQKKVSYDQACAKKKYRDNLG